MRPPSSLGGASRTTRSSHGSAALCPTAQDSENYGDLFFETIEIAEALSAELIPHSARGWAGLPAHPLDYHHDDRGLADTASG